jgi:RNA recognition motif-containing protein
MAAAIETKLYVTNFPSSATRQQLQQFFSRFGRVQECASKIINNLIFKFSIYFI